MKIIGCLALASILLTHTFVIASGQSQKEVMTNASVVGLVKAGLGDAVIIQKIRRSEPRFDTSDAGLKQLRAAGVSDNVILEMMNVGNSTTGPGTEPGVRAPYPASTAPPSQPRQSDDLYASIVDGSAKHRLNGSHARFVRAKVKDKEMTLASLAASSAVNEAVHDVLMEGVYKASGDILFSNVGRNLLFPGMTVLGGMGGGVGIVTDKVGSKLFGPRFTCVSQDRRP